MTGVSASTTNDVMVFFIEGESQNTTSLLYGPAGGSTYADKTLGDWVTNTLYPIIDPPAAQINTFNTNYNVSYFPTIYMICRDRLIQEVGALSTEELYAAATASCPSYAPSTTTDAKAIIYTGKSFFTCTANPTVKFQNYGATTITNATVKLYSGSTLVSTQNWTGSLAPFEVASVTFSSFSPSQFGPYHFEVVVNDDSQAANNISEDELFVVYNNDSPFPTPYSEDFEWDTVAPANIQFTGSDLYLFNGFNASQLLVQADGTLGTAILAYFYNANNGSVSEMMIGNFNTASMTAPTLEFEVSYKQYQNENDKLEVLVSTNCGASWNTVYSKAGSILATGPATNNRFYPTDASMWRHETVDLSAYTSGSTFIKFRTTSNYGNDLFIDNINLSNALAVPQVAIGNDIKLYPNPASHQAILDLNLSEQAKVTVSVIDVAGREVYTSNNVLNAGANKVVVPTAQLANGLYQVKVQSGSFSTVKQLSVVK